MGIWYTWLAYLGLIFGLLASIVAGTSLARSAAIGFAGGIVLVILWNIVEPTPAPCLQHSKGWDVLRAYSFC
jgi:galactitol-specific phosphotransferase system IIC component